MKNLTIKFFTDNREWLLRTGLGTLAAVVLVYVLGRIGVVVGSPHAIMIFLILILIVWTSFATQRSVGDYVGRKTGVMANTLPAPVWQKFLLAWSVSVIGGVVLYVLVVWALNSLAAAMDWMHMSKGFFFGSDTPSLGTVWNKLYEPIGAGCIVSSVVMLFKLSVDRHGGFARQAVIGAIAVAAMVVLLIKLPEWLGIPSAGTQFPFFLDLKVWIWNDKGGVGQAITWVHGEWHRAISDLVTMSIPIVFWVASYFKLKEIEP